MGILALGLGHIYVRSFFGADKYNTIQRDRRIKHKIRDFNFEL